MLEGRNKQAGQCLFNAAHALADAERADMNNVSIEQIVVVAVTCRDLRFEIGPGRSFMLECKQSSASFRASLNLRTTQYKKDGSSRASIPNKSECYSWPMNTNYELYKDPSKRKSSHQIQPQLPAFCSLTTIFLE
jgi:hypothetical protein